MQRVTVIYPRKDDAKFDFDYYTRKHLPLATKLLGKSIEACKGLSSPTGAPPAFLCVATIPINSLEEFQTLFSQHGAEIMADIPKFTNIEPIIQLDEILAA